MTKKYEEYLEWVIRELEQKNKEQEDRHSTAIEFTSKILKLQIELWEAQWERDWLKMVVERLEEENKELQKDLEHRDSFFSIMRDVLANETITNNKIAMITYCVVHEECGDYDLSEKELEVVKKFRNREYV